MIVQKKNEHYRQLALDYKNRAKLKKCMAAIHDEYLMEEIYFHKYPEINKIEKDIKTFFPN
jgi:hypothetical protein